MKNQKGITPVIIALIVAVILGGGYLVIKAQNSKKTVVTDETVNWKTYTNTEYGFEFKYPPSVFPNDRGDAKDLVTSFTNGPDLDDGKPLSFVSVYVNSAENIKSFPEYLAKYPVKYGNGDKPLQFKTRTLGQNTFYYARTELFEGLLSFRYYILHGNKVYKFVSIAHGVDELNPNFNGENDSTHVALKQILSTFKFTK